MDGQVVLEFPELFLEKYREIVARDTGEPCDSLFFSASISTRPATLPHEFLEALIEAMDSDDNEEEDP